MTKNNTLTWRVERLEKAYESIDTRLDKLMENDLPHLKSDIESLKTRINMMTAINVASIIVGILIAKYL